MTEAECMDCGLGGNADDAQARHRMGRKESAWVCVCLSEVHVRYMLHAYILTYTLSCRHTQRLIHTYIHTYRHTYIHKYIQTYIHTNIDSYFHKFRRTYIHTSIA